jgi:putative transposase
VVSIHRTDFVVTNDLTQHSTEARQQACGFRRKIEQLHREGKQVTGLEACQCRKARIQRNHMVRAYEKGDGSIRQLARRYEVTKNTVQAWLERKRSTGSVTPLLATGGKVSQLVGFEKPLEAMVQTHPDYTLAQYCETWWEHQGVAVAESPMCRWLQQRA